MKFQVKIHLNFQVKFQVNMEAQVGQLHVKFQVKFHSKFQVKFHSKDHMKLALQSFRIFGTLVGSDCGVWTFHLESQWKVRTPESKPTRVPKMLPVFEKI